MSRFKRILLMLMAVFLLPFSVFYSHAEDPEVSGDTPADIQKGAVPENVVFHGRLERDGAPYNGKISLKLRIYASASGDDYIWESDAVEGVNVEQGLFHQTFVIPMSVLGEAGQKYYSIISDAGTVSIGAINNGRMPLDSAIYALASKGLEENSTVVLSTVIVAQGGNIYLNTAGAPNTGAICFQHPGSAAVCQNNSSIPSSAELKSDAHVFVNASDSVGIKVGPAEPKLLMMHISQNGNVGIGTSDPKTDLHIGKAVGGAAGILPNVTIVETSTHSRILGNTETGRLNVKEISVSTITNASYNEAEIDYAGGIFLNDNIRLRSFRNSTQENQLVLSSATVMVSTNIAPVNTAGEALRVDGEVYASEGIISGNVYISTDNEISVNGGSSQNLVFNRQGCLSLPCYGLSIGAQEPVGAALYVSNGGLRADRLDVGKPQQAGHIEFKDNVSFYGDHFRVNITTAVHLGNTIIYGNLYVSQNSDIASPAYSEKYNLFTSTAVFNGEIFISTSNADSYLSASNIFVAAGGTPLFNEGKYLQIGDAAPSYSDRDSYLALNSADSEEGSVDFNLRSGKNNILVSSITAVRIPEAELHIYGGNAELVLSTVPAHGKHQVLRSSFTVLRNGINAISAYTAASSGKVFFGNVSGSHAEDNAVVSGQLYVNEIRFHDGSRMSSSYTGGPGLDHIDGGGSRVAVETSTGIIRMQNSGSNVLIISTSGKAGIGLNSPSQALTLSDSSSLMVGSDVFVPDSSIKVKTNNINTSGSIYAGSGGIYTNSTERISNAGVFKSGTVWNGSILSLSNGGTGLSEVAANTVLKVKNNSASLDKMFAEKLNLADSNEVTGGLKIANGGTGLTAAPAVGPLGISSSGAIRKKDVRLSVDTENILGISNGGLGARQPGETGILISDGVKISSGAVNLSENVSNILKVANGGTGKDFTSNDYKDKVLYASGTTNIDVLTMYSGRPLIGRSTAPAAVIWQLKDIGKNNTAAGVNFSIPQSVSTTAYVTFAGLKFQNPKFVSAVLKTNSGGLISTHTIVLEEYLTDTLSIANGGTGTGGTGTPLPAGLLKSNGSRLVSGADYKLNMSSEVSGILPIVNGGTGRNTFSKGDMPVYSAGSMNVLNLASNSNGKTVIGKTGNSPNVNSISGTTNRVNVDKASGAMTVSLPQSIHENATPAFGNLTLTDLNGFVKANGSGSSLSAVSAVSLAEDVSGILSPANGGTGSGDISAGLLRANNSSFSSGLADLGSSGDVSGVLAIENGGFNHNIAADGTTGMLKMWGSSVTVAALNLNSGSADYDSGTVLPLANGGTGSSSIPAGIVYYNGVQLTTSAVSLTGDVSGTLNVANGGTGLTSLQGSRVITVNNSGTVAAAALNSKGRILAGGNSGTVAAVQLANNSGSSNFNINSNTTGSIHISAAQSIKESASPVFTGLTLNGTDTSGGILYADNTGSISTTTLLITEHLSALGTVSLNRGGTNLSSIAAGPLLSYGGAVVSGSVSVSDNVNGTLPVSHGGTGLNSIDEGRLIQAVSSAELAPLYLEAGQTVIGTSSGLSAAYISGADNQVAVSTGSGSIQIGLVQDIANVSSPVFAGINLSGFNGFIKATGGLTDSAQKISLESDMSGILGVNRGGTGQSYITPGILFQSGNFGSDKIDLGNNLDTQVTGILPVANGGLGVNFTGSTGVIQYNAEAFSLLAVDIATQTTGSLPVSNGGFGTADFNTESIVAADVYGEYVPIELPYANMLSANSSGEPAAASFVPVNGITVSTSVFVSSVAINLGLPQPLHSAADVTFAGMRLLDYAGGGERFLKLDTSLMPAQSPLQAVEPQFADISGNFGTDKGGTGTESITSGGIIYSSSSVQIGHISLSQFQILLGNSSGQPVAANVIPDAMTGVSVAPANPPDISTIVVRAAQDVSTSASPSFTGMTLNIPGLNSQARPYLTLKGTKAVSLSAPDAVLANNLGGTGFSSLTQDEVFIANQYGNIDSVALSEGEIIIRNNSGNLIAGRIAGTDNQVIVSTVSDGLQISLPQDLFQSSDVRFSTVSASFEIKAATMTITGNLTADDISVDVIKVGGLLIPVDTGCKTGDSGSMAGQIKFCKTRHAALSSDIDLNKLVFYDGEDWRCADNGEKICNVAALCSSATGLCK